MNNAATIVLRHLQAEKEPTGKEALEALVSTHHFTVGFTIENIRPLLNAYKNRRDGAAAGNEIIGWVFKYPNSTQNIPIAGIKIYRLEIQVSVNSSQLVETELTQPDGSAVVIIPKVLYQQRVFPPGTTSGPYQPSYHRTQPRIVTDYGLSVSEMEDHYSWAELALLQRFDLDNFADYFIGGPQGYNDVFFSGANLDFATMHHPVMRLEQFSLQGGTIPMEEARRPFTLKAEPYIADSDLNWLPHGNAVFAPPPAGGAQTRQAGAVNPATVMTGLPVAAFMYPCPTAWDYGTLVATSAAQQLGITDTGVVAKMQMQINGLYTGTAQPSPKGSFTIQGVDRSALPKPTILEPGKNTGCLSFLGFGVFLFLIFMSW